MTEGSGSEHPPWCLSGPLPPISQADDAPGMDQADVFSADYIAAALRGARVGVWHLDASTDHIIWDSVAEAIVCLASPCTVEALLHKTLPQDRAAIEKFFLSLSHADDREAVDFRIVRPEGTVRWLRCLGCVLPGLNGPSIAPGGLIRDVTVRKETELHLLENKRQLNTLINNLQGIAYRTEALPPWRILFVSKGVEGLLGYDVAEFERGERIWASLIHPDDLEIITQQVKEAIAKRRPYAISYRLLHRSGEIRWVRERGEAVYDEHGQALFIEGLISDITDIIRSQATLREAKELLETVIEGIPDAVFLKNYKEGGRYILVNSALERLAQISAAQIIGRTDEELFSPQVAADNRKQDHTIAQKQLPSLVIEQSFQTAFGDRLLEVRKLPLFDEDGELQYILGIVRDLTDQRALEQKVREMQRMEAVGQLTGGIAHDFNNLLAIILGYAELLRDSVSDPSLMLLTEKVIDASERGADLVRRLMVFARKHRLEPHVISLNERLPGVIALLGRTLGEHIRVNLNLAPDLWPAKVDPSQVDDAIVNLALNSRDAMPDGGLITFETANVSFNQEEASRLVDVEPGDYVMLAVSDTGHGMTPDVVARVFEPFFTTKDQGRGTGLGLSMVYGFAKQSGGHVLINSALGHGTRVCLFLPKAMDLHEPGTDERRNLAIVGGQEAVLLVEDNENVRAMATLHLRKLGYHVLEASNGVEALELLQNDVKVDLLFTDIVMPEGLSGYELAQRVREKMPHLPVLFTTGYDSPGTYRPPEKLPNSGLLYKPYRRQGLAMAIRKALDQARLAP